LELGPIADADVEQAVLVLALAAAEAGAFVDGRGEREDGALSEGGRGTNSARSFLLRARFFSLLFSLSSLSLSPQ